MRLGKEGENYRITHGAGKRPKDWLDNGEGSCPTEYTDNLQEGYSVCRSSKLNIYIYLVEEANEDFFPILELGYLI